MHLICRARAVFPKNAPSASFSPDIKKHAQVIAGIASFIILAFALLWGSLTRPVHAQSAEPLKLGEGVATRFAGVTLGDGKDRTSHTRINLDGIVASVIDLRRPRFAPDGRHWTDEPQRLRVTAGQTGQVFGVAIDDARPANIYLTATAAFGLHRLDDASGWMEGMWGPGAGPGTIYRLRGDNGYQPEIFARVMLNGRANTGASLGNIVYDRWHKQLLVSDMETGMIHRISAIDGKDLGTFDHGVDARAWFFDVPTGKNLSLKQKLFYPDTGPRFKECVSVSNPGQRLKFSTYIPCWNLADFRRRIWGLGLHRDQTSGTIRLYYAVWGHSAFDNPEWQGSGDDKRNAIWSIPLNGAGSFDPTAIRREFFVPDFAGPDDKGNWEENRAVSDIAISRDGVMLIAERGGMRNFGLDTEAAFSTPHQARILRYGRDAKGAWQLTGRYDVGYRDRRVDGQPFLRSNAAGGVDFGYGYMPDWTVDARAPDKFVWMSGDSLCSAEGLCYFPQSKARADDEEVHGLQGTPSTAFDQILPAQAYQPYPPQGPVYDPKAPDKSYMIDTDINVTRRGGPVASRAWEKQTTEIGDIEIYKFYGRPAQRVPPPAYEIDFGIAKRSISCTPGGICTYRITVTYLGNVEYDGPVTIQDRFVSTLWAPLISARPRRWRCAKLGATTTCRRQMDGVKPGQQFGVDLTFQLPAAYRKRRIDNCASLVWIQRGGDLPVRTVQEALEAHDYYSGPIDGVISAELAQAIKAFEAASGLPENGRLTEQIVTALLGPDWRDIHAGVGPVNPYGDGNPRNNRACTSVLLAGGPAPGPAHARYLSRLHPKFFSWQHNKFTTRPFPGHKKWRSQFHSRFASWQHNRRTTRRIPAHRRWLSRFHARHASWVHNRRTTRPVAGHIRWRSQFHSRFASWQHNRKTTKAIRGHRKWRSNMHARYASWQHHRPTTRPITGHKKWRSQFHLRFATRLHNSRTTRVKRNHNRRLSRFHTRATSRQHNRRTSRPIRVHAKRLSRRIPPGRHIRTQSIIDRQNLGPPGIIGPVGPGLHTKRRTAAARHARALSAFHRTARSSRHDRGTTKARRVIHARALSRLHRRVRSSQHNARTSRTNRPAHASALSRFHRRRRSAAHNAATSRQARPVHQAARSAFHRRASSSLHVARTSRAARPVHAPAVSTFHARRGSALHNGKTSRRIRPVHAPAVSAFHRRTRSNFHNTRTSLAVRPRHAPAVSRFHRRSTSALHDPRTTRQRRRRHRTSLSSFHRRAPSSLHIARTSRRRVSVHLPARSLVRRPVPIRRHDPRTTRFR